MSLKLLLIASFFVAMLAMLGGAPICRIVAAKLRPRSVHRNSAVGAGGLVLAFALLLVSFYLTPLPESANPLLGAIGLTLLFNFILWRGLSPQRARLWRYRLGPVLMLFALLGLIGLPSPLIFGSTGMLLTIGFIVVLTLTPLALAGLGDRLVVRSAMNSSYLIVTAMIGILTMALKADFASGMPFRSVVDVLHVFLPAFGAIAGCSFYTFNLPWRNGAQIYMGASGQMIMGLICAWAAIHIAEYAPRPGATMVAVLWMMLPALFEAGRDQIRIRVVPTLQADQVHPFIYQCLIQPSSTLVIYGLSMLMMIVGLASFWSTSAAVWASGVAIPFAFGIYVIVGGWVSKMQAPTQVATAAIKTRAARRL